MAWCPGGELSGYRVKVFSQVSKICESISDFVAVSRTDGGELTEGNGVLQVSHAHHLRIAVQTPTSISFTTSQHCCRATSLFESRSLDADHPACVSVRCVRSVQQYHDPWTQCNGQITTAIKLAIKLTIKLKT